MPKNIQSFIHIPKCRLASLHTGRSALKQYMPLKPVKRGMKVWLVAESSTGYFLDLQVYVGKEGEVGEHALGERVVLELTEKFKGKGYRVFCDNFFSSLRLFQLLHSHNYICMW